MQLCNEKGKKRRSLEGPAIWQFHGCYKELAVGPIKLVEFIVGESVPKFICHVFIALK